MLSVCEALNLDSFPLIFSASVSTRTIYGIGGRNGNSHLHREPLLLHGGPGKMAPPTAVARRGGFGGGGVAVSVVAVVVADVVVKVDVVVMLLVVAARLTRT